MHHAVELNRQHDFARGTACPTQRPHRRRRADRRLLRPASRPRRPGAAGRVRHLRAPRVVAGHRVQRGPHRSRPPRRSCEYRAAQGTDGPLFIGARHPRAVRAGRAAPRWRCSPPTASTVLHRRRRRLHADAGASRTRSCTANRGARTAGWPTASSSPRRTTRPRDGGFKYNPPNGGPADTDATAGSRTAPTSSSRPARRTCSAIAYDAGPRADTTGYYDFLDVLRRATCANVLDIDAIRAAGRAHRRRPAGRRLRRLLGRDRRAATASTSTVVNPSRRPDVGVHDAGLGRQDPDGLLVAVRDGVAGRRGATQYDIATGNDADADRHGIVTPDAGLMNPNHYLAVAIQYLYSHRPDWPRRRRRSARPWCRRR